MEFSLASDVLAREVPLRLGKACTMYNGTFPSGLSILSTIRFVSLVMIRHIAKSYLFLWLRQAVKI